MANTNAARGLIPWRQANGQYMTGGLGLYYLPATYNQAVFVGDPMIATGASDAFGVPVVQLASAGSGNYSIGPMVSIANGGPNNAVVAITRDLPVYHVAATSQYILVADDPNEMFVIQEDGAMTVATVGTKNAYLVAGTGSTVTGYSGWQLQSSSVNTSNTRQLRIIRALMEEDNTPGSTNAKWLVKINLHSMLNTTGI